VVDQVQVVVELVMEVVELEDIEPLVLDLPLYKEVHYSYHQDLIQLQLVVVERKFLVVLVLLPMLVIMEVIQYFLQ
jgi:hypothetical protein